LEGLRRGLPARDNPSWSTADVHLAAFDCFGAPPTALCSESMYVTNAIKRFLRRCEGLHSDQLDESRFKESEGVWHGELRELAGHGAFPQVIVIFGEPFWRRACETFGRRDLGFEVSGHCWVKSDRLHFANRYQVNIAGAPQALLLIRMDHPAAHGERRTAVWLFEDEAFRGVLC